MASEAINKKFIETIAPYAQKAYKTLGKVLPSVCIAMACTECGYGTAASVLHHSYIGQKVGTGKTATKYWGGRFFLSKTKEEYKVGSHTVITDAFRSYDSMEQCVFNYYELLNKNLYARVKSGVDYRTQMQQIKLCGYMTSSTEVATVIKIIGRYNLTKYDQGITAAENVVYPVPEETIRKGMKGPGVIWLQQKLNEHGFALILDGEAGSKTIGALMVYQSQNGLKPDGICGPLTKAKLTS